MELSQLLNNPATKLSNRMSENTTNTQDGKENSFLEALTKLLTKESREAVTNNSNNKLLIKGMFETISHDEEMIMQIDKELAELMEVLENSIIPVIHPNFQKQIPVIETSKTENNLNELFSNEAGKTLIAENFNLNELFKKIGIDVVNLDSISKVINQEENNEQKLSQLISHILGEQNQEKTTSTTAKDLDIDNIDIEKNAIIRLNFPEKRNENQEQLEVKGQGIELNDKKPFTVNNTFGEAQENSTDGNHAQPSLNRETNINNIINGNLPFSRIIEEANVSQVVEEPAMTPKELPDFILKQISNNLKFNKLTGSSELSIRLKPEELGKVTLQLLAQDGQISVKIITESIRAREMIEQNLLHLKQTFESQGIKCTDIDVQVNTDSSFNQFMGHANNPFNHTRYFKGKSNFIRNYDKNQIMAEGITDNEGTVTTVSHLSEGLELLA